MISLKKDYKKMKPKLKEISKKYLSNKLNLKILKLIIINY